MSFIPVVGILGGLIVYKYGIQMCYDGLQSTYNTTIVIGTKKAYEVSIYVVQNTIVLGTKKAYEVSIYVVQNTIVLGTKKAYEVSIYVVQKSITIINDNVNTVLKYFN